MGKREKQKKMSGADILHLVLTFFQCVADYGCCIYSALLLFVMPLYYTDGFSHIGSDKALFFRNLNRNMGKILIPVGIVLVLLKIILRRLVSEPDLKEKWALERRKFSLTDCVCRRSYGVCVTISYLLSDYQEMAWYGAERGWFMGFCTQIALVGISISLCPDSGSPESGCSGVFCLFLPLYFFWGILTGLGCLCWK